MLLKKRLFTLIAIFLLMLPFAYSQVCEVAKVKEVLRKTLHLYFTEPGAVSLTKDEVRDILVFYLGIGPQSLTVDCSVLGTKSNKPIFEIINIGENLPDKIPSCADGTKYGECSKFRPAYCYAGAIYSKCDLCGCPANSVCGKAGKCEPLAQNITCYKDIDCGQNDFVGRYYCANDYINRNYSEYLCLNAGTVNSKCASANGTTMLTYCDPSLNQICIEGQSTCQTTVNDSAPTVSISVNPATVAQGQFFNVTVIGTDDVGLAAIWWWAESSSDSELNKAHWYNCNGAKMCKNSWLVSTNATGVLTLGANSRDTTYAALLSCTKEDKTQCPGYGEPHQASEGAGIAYAYLTVTSAVSNATSIGILTIKGRLIDYFTKQPIANGLIYTWDSQTARRDTYTNANGEFSTTADTTLVTATSPKPFGIEPKCYNNMGFALFRNSDNNLYVNVQINSLIGPAKSFSVSGSELNVGDIPMWPAVDIQINSDIAVKFNLEYNGITGPGNSLYKTLHYLSYSFPLTVNTRTKLTDQANNIYYSPYLNLPLSNGCAPVNLNFYNKQFAWNTTTAQTNTTNQTTLQAPTGIRAGWGITNDNSKKSSLFFYAINFAYNDPLPSAFRVYLKKPGESAFTRAAEFTNLGAPCGTFIFSGSWLLYRRCESTSSWKIDSPLLPTTSYPLGAYRFYLAAVDAAGKEVVSSEFEMYNLQPLTVLSPTSAQSPVSSTPTFQWTVASGWPISNPSYFVSIYDDAKFGEPWMIHSKFVSASTSSTTVSYVYDGPALDPAKKYVVRVYGLYRAFTTTICPSCDYISMDASTQTFWVSGNQTIINQTLTPPTRVSADFSYSYDLSGSAAVILPMISFQFPSADITDKNIKYLRLYNKKPGESVFSKVAEFTNLPTTPGYAATTAFGGWKLSFTFSPSSWLVFAVTSTGANDHQPASNYAVGAHSYYITAVDSSGRESDSSVISTINILSPITISSPTAAQSPVSSTPTFQWTLPAGWPSYTSPTYLVYVIDQASNKYQWQGNSKNTGLVYSGTTLDPAKKYSVMIEAEVPINEQEMYFTISNNLAQFWVSGNQTNITTCTDSDGGFNIYKSGLTDGRVNGIGQYFYDTCVQSNGGACSYPICAAVAEGYCADGKVTNLLAQCPNGCQNGACINQTTSKPDLIVSDITFSPANPTTADYTNVYFIIKNIGSATAWNFSTKVEYVGGQSFLFGTGALQPGATTQTGSLTNYWPAGTNTFKATVDINNNVAELDENNNALTKSVTVLSTTNQTTLKGYAETCTDGKECKYNLTCISDPLDNNIGKCGWWGSTGTFSQCSAGYYPSTPCMCGSMAIYAGACNHGIFYWPPTQAGKSVGSSCTDSSQCSTGICIFGLCSYAVRCHPQTPGYCHDHEECVAFGASC